MGKGVLNGTPREQPGQTISAGPGDAASGDVTSPDALLADVLLADAGLVRRGRSLEVGTASAVPLAAIADAVGTPTYVYHADMIRARYRALDTALAPVPHRICYAVKANSNLAVLRILAELGAGADIVSGGELARVRAAGFPAERIVFSGVGKTAAELRDAVEAGVGHINIESLEELARLGAIAADLRREVVIGIRVNPDVTADTHPYISTGTRGIKFGIPIDQVVPAAESIARHAWLRLGALAVHLGSQLLDVQPFEEGIGRLLELLEALRRAGLPLPAGLDVGGGLGVRYVGERRLAPEQFAAAVVSRLAPTGLIVMVEPGRYLVGPAGVLLTRVLYRKHSGGKEFVIVDAGMNDLVRPSYYQAHHEIVEVEAAGRPVARVDVVGPVCETGDFLALDRQLPDVAAGELLAILGAGAYGFVMASNYNARPRPAEVIVEGGRFWVARPRERVDELFASERLREET